MFEERISKIFQKYRKEIFISLMLIFWGYICHGYMFFSKLPNFDDAVSLYNKGLTVEVGRWFIPFTNFLSKGMSIPAVIGLVSLVFIVVSVWVVCDLLSIRYKIYVFIIGLLMVSFPVVTGTFTFMFTADAYFLSLLFASVSVWILGKKTGIIRTIVSCILLCLSIGIYQAYYNVACALVCIYVMQQFLKDKNECLRKNGTYKNMMAMFFSLVMGMFLYLVVNKLVFMIVGVNYETATLLELLKNIPKAIENSYRDFISIFLVDFAGISYCKAVRICLLGLAVLFFVVYEKLLTRRGRWNVICGNIALIVFPVSLNFINFAMLDRAMDTLMIYSYIFIPILPLMVISNSFKSIKKESIYKTIVCILLVVISWQYMLQSNRVYVGMDLAKTSAISYYTAIITEIKMTQGYHDDMPVVFLGEDTEDETVFNNGEMYRGNVRGVMHLKRYINMYSRESFMAYYCGFSPAKYSGDLSELKAQDRIQKMPCYPDAGSIKVIDDVLIVKIGK